MKAILKDYIFSFNPPKRKKFNIFQKLNKRFLYTTKYPSISFLPNHPGRSKPNQMLLNKLLGLNNNFLKDSPVLIYKYKQVVSPPKKYFITTKKNKLFNSTFTKSGVKPPSHYISFVWRQNIIIIILHNQYFFFHALSMKFLGTNGNILMIRV